MVDTENDMILPKLKKNQLQCHCGLFLGPNVVYGAETTLEICSELFMDGNKWDSFENYGPSFFGAIVLLPLTPL